MPVRRIEMLCLANSKKEGGKCIAGVDLGSGEWIRPVSSQPHGELYSSDCALEDGALPKLLDVVSVPVVEPVPQPHQPENWLIVPKPWKLVARLTLDDARDYLDPLCAAGPELFRGRSDRIAFEDIQRAPLAESLALIYVDRPTFEFNPWHVFRARFVLEDQYYDFGLTDLSGWATEAKNNAPVHSAESWYFTISLTEPFGTGNNCFKLVAAGIEDT